MTDGRVPDLSTVNSPPRRSDIEFEAVKGGELIGSGGQATVKRVPLSGPDPPDTVAVKQPQAPSETLDTAVIESFFNEADTWATLAKRERTDQHRDTDHIVGVVAMGEDFPWLAMEYMDGGNLADRLDSHPTGLPIDEALWIAECLCEGLKLAHDNGVAHLDLKAENILFRETPGDKWDVPKIADWGLARSLLADSQSMEMLSVEYAAPEQFNSDEFGKPDSYTDIYQIGAIIYEMLTGEPPYTGGQTEVMYDVVHGDDPDPPSSRREQIPDALDEVVLKALNADKEKRYRGSIDRLEDAVNDIRQPAKDGNISNSLEEGEVTEKELSDHRSEYTQSWQMFQANPARTGQIDTTGPQNHPITLEWVFSTHGEVNPSPAVADDTVFIGSDDGYVYAIDANTGSGNWAFETGGRVHSSPAVADGTVFIGSGDGYIYALNANTGATEWKFKTNSWVMSSPTVVNGTVWVCDTDGGFYAIDINSGSGKLVFQADGEVVSSPAVVNNTAFFGDSVGKIYGIDLSSKDVVAGIDTDAGVYSSPAVADGTVIVGNNDDIVYGFDANTSRQQWEFHLSSGWLSDAHVESSPAVANGIAYFGSVNNTIYGVDISTGSQRWAFQTEDCVDCSPAVADGVVYIGSNDNHLYALDADTGSGMWKYQTGGEVYSSPAVVDGTVFFGSYDSGVYALSEGE